MVMEFPASVAHVATDPRGSRHRRANRTPPRAPRSHVFMARPLQDVRRLLAEIRNPGSFATQLTTAATDLHVTVKGVGRLHLPLTKAQALELRAVGRPARHGFKHETRLDPRVRDTWEIPGSRISSDRRTWNRTLLPMLDVVRRDLGLPDHARLKADLHNMLIYEPGQFFTAHQDSEKADDMIGTLVVILPSSFSGGEMVIEHQGQQVVVGGARTRLTCAAFYADCHHQVRPVTRGYRCVLTYNLILAGSAPTATVEPPRPIDALARYVRRFFDTRPPLRWAHDKEREPPDRLVYLLDHQYTQRGLGWDRLKNGDAARVAALREVARQLDCEIFLALADVHETWQAEAGDPEFGYGSRYGHRRGWHDDDDEYDGDDGADDGEAHAVSELIDSDVELRHWIGLGARARPEAISAYVSRDELCDTRPSSDLKPFQSEYEGYMGNYGNTMDRWYHRAAVVLWPRERTFVIRGRASARWAIGEIARALKADEQTARALTARVRPFWAQAARGERGRGFFERTAKTAAGLGDPELAALLLQPFTLPHLNDTAAPHLVALLDRFGSAWCQTLIGTWAADRHHEDRQARLPWLASALPAVCRTLRESGARDALTLGCWLVQEQWTWLVGERREIREHEAPKHVAAALAALGPPMLGLIESTVVTVDAVLHGEMIALLTAPDEYVVDEVTGVLRAAHDRYPRAVRRHLDLHAVHTRCVDELTTLLSATRRVPGDWSIADVIACRCALCKTLTRFLRASEQTRFEWPLAKDRRLHVHRIVDGHGLPLTHLTRRTGRPYTLVLEKTKAVFERDAAIRRSRQQDLVWLRKTAAAFRA